MGAESPRPRLLELAQRYKLTMDQRGRLEDLLSALHHDAQAPTSVRCPSQAVDIHVADSLVALELEVVAGARAIADLGSGAGFPGLALAVALRRAELRLIESNMRKCAYLERVIAEAGVRNARVVCARAEDWSAGQGSNDVVLARALAAQAVVVEYAAPLLRLGGTLADWRGKRSGREEEQAARAAEQLGMRRVEIRRTEPFAGAKDRHLHLYVKVKPTPSRFPRRAGVARRRPLGGPARAAGERAAASAEARVSPRASDRERR
jgi:16S rRNA (guanine527-N7)-methyltransferase